MVVGVAQRRQTGVGCLKVFWFVDIQGADQPQRKLIGFSEFLGHRHAKLRCVDHARIKCGCQTHRCHVIKKCGRSIAQGLFADNAQGVGDRVNSRAFYQPASWVSQFIALEKVGSGYGIGGYSGNVGRPQGERVCPGCVPAFVNDERGSVGYHGV